MEDIPGIDFITATEYSLSEPSTSLSLGHDTLDHLMPEPHVPTLDLRSLRAESKNARSRPASSRSTKPPHPPANHGLHQDVLLWSSNRPENYPKGKKAMSFFKLPRPPNAAPHGRLRGAHPRPGRPQTSRQLRPKTTDPGTLTSRTTSTAFGKETNTKRPSTSSDAAQPVRLCFRRPKVEDSGSDRDNTVSAPSVEKGARRSNSSTQVPSCASAVPERNAYSQIISPRLEEISRPNSLRSRKKHISADHSIVYTGEQPRLAYHKPEDLPESAIYIQALPKREDHPELPTNTPTIQMHRPKALRKMRRLRQERLEAAAARKEPHAIRELADKRERERLQLMKERRMRAMRKAVFMRGLKKMTSGADEKIRNRPSNGSQGVRRSAQRIAMMKENRLQKRAYVYREWDEYRDPTLTNPKPQNGTDIHNKNAAEDNPLNVRRTIDGFNSLIKENEVIWAPKTSKQVLAEERLYSNVMKNVGPKMKKRFENYVPKVSTSKMRKIVQIRRASDRLLAEMQKQREGSKPDQDFRPAGEAWRDEEIMAKLEKGVVLDNDY